MNMPLFAHLHGHLGVLAAAFLVHPAWMLRDRARRAPKLVVAAAALTSVAFGGGLFVYPAYRETARRGLFAAHPALGWAFERKEHLAVGVLAFAIAGAALHLAEPYFTGLERATLRRCAWLSFVLAASSALVVVVLGTMVASTAPLR